MADFKTLKGTINKTIDNQTIVNEIKNFSSNLYGGIMYSLCDLDITQFCYFNQKNDAAMRYHMRRNDVQKSLTMDGLGENAYSNGNANIDSIPVPEYSYSAPHSYIQYSRNIHNVENGGQLSTRVSNINTGEVINEYFDYDGPAFPATNPIVPVSPVSYTGNGEIDRNNMIYKTRRLFNQNKVKSIISQFHTDNTVQYKGQVGSRFGESHGRNLLTKDAEDHGGNGTIYNGYNNPYCRVWTHHYTYDRLSKTMRANPLMNDVTNSINYWGKEFEWDSDDAGHVEDKTKYGDGERYDYAWRGHHNQQRRLEHTVLDEKTGLVTIAPKFAGGGDKNVHTKSCMFSIENLAWKDYDPYSFEEALSWEQRGPMGGRIMWFPPYNIKITETNSARWNQHDFIGRGEPVYTYTNSERTGTLSFTMLVDHPSSVDYSSWYDDNSADNGPEGMHTDNDYHRYFAGCFGGMAFNTVGDERMREGDNTPEDAVNAGRVYGKNGGDNLMELPPHLTDEYTKVQPNVIKPEREKVEPKEPEEVAQDGDTPKVVNFYVFYPNNYSGYYDKLNTPRKEYDSKVDAILYLLAGDGAQKEKDGYKDIELSEDKFNIKGNDHGYEMTNEKGISRGLDNSIWRAKLDTGNTYQKEPDKNTYYQYRIDCYLDNNGKYGVEELTTNNTINQKLSSEKNYKDENSFKLNLDAGSVKTNLNKGDDDTIYSLAEIAYAVYSLKQKRSIIDYLENLLGKEQKERAKVILDVFKNYPLTNIAITGISNMHGEDNASDKQGKDHKHNTALAKHRGETVLKWLQSVTQFQDKTTNVQSLPAEKFTEDGKKNVDSIGAKINRSAHIKLTFNTSSTISANQSDSKDSNATDTNPQSSQNTNSDFDETKWLLIDDLNANAYLKGGYECSSVGNIEYSNETFAFVESGKNNVPVNNDNAATYFNNYKGVYSKDVNYNRLDICFYNNKFYAAKQDYDYTGNTNNANEELKDKYVNVKDNNLAGYHGFTYIGSKEHGDGSVWDYYRKNAGMTYFEEVDNGVSENSSENNVGDEISVTKEQVIDIIKNIEKEKNPPFNEIIKLNNYKGNYDVKGSYQTNDIVTQTSTQTSKEYIYIDKLSYTWNQDCWGEITTEEAKEHFGSSYINNIDFSIQNKIQTVEITDNYAITNLLQDYNVGDYISLSFSNGEVIEPYIIKEIGGYKNIDKLQFCEYNSEDTYEIGDIVKKDDDYYIIRIVDESVIFDETYKYHNGEICYYDGIYHVNNGKFNDEYWAELECFDEVSKQIFEKASIVLCSDMETLLNEYHPGWFFIEDTKLKDTFNLVKFYGNNEESNSYSKIYKSQDIVNKTDSLIEVAKQHIDNFTDDEESFLKDVVDYSQNQRFKECISLYNLLDNIDYTTDKLGNKDKVCKTSEQVEKLMEEKKMFEDNPSDYDKDCNNIWIDRGDGLLIQECELLNGLDGTGRIKSRGKAFNKLRYDQEYYFYRRYFADHPILFNKLTEKIKYFNPMYHSMTPEGFNGRLTFLNQCTRQGATMTRSDKLDGTANNLAFGRAPYCVLRLGDFYHQMIVIESISYDFSVSNGLQWDLNTEGNGVQPMLCDVNISFKFIGGGDITGPVRRLQNAMSFNYYANTSFYDNRADRVEYQDTNWATMGGAGNNKVDIDKSYSYSPAIYKDDDTITPNLR